MQKDYPVKVQRVWLQLLRDGEISDGIFVGNAQQYVFGKSDDFRRHAEAGA